MKRPSPPTGVCCPEDRLGTSRNAEAVDAKCPSPRSYPPGHLYFFEDARDIYAKSHSCPIGVYQVEIDIVVYPGRRTLGPPEGAAEEVEPSTDIQRDIDEGPIGDRHLAEEDHTVGGQPQPPGTACVVEGESLLPRKNQIGVDLTRLNATIWRRTTTLAINLSQRLYVKIANANHLVCVRRRIYCTASWTVVAVSSNNHCSQIESVIGRLRNGAEIISRALHFRHNDAIEHAHRILKGPNHGGLIEKANAISVGI